MAQGRRTIHTRPPAHTPHHPTAQHSNDTVVRVSSSTRSYYIPVYTVQLQLDCGAISTNTNPDMGSSAKLKEISGTLTLCRAPPRSDQCPRPQRCCSLPLAARAPCSCSLGSLHHSGLYFVVLFRRRCSSGAVIQSKKVFPVTTSLKSFLQPTWVRVKRPADSTIPSLTLLISCQYR